MPWLRSPRSSASRMPARLLGPSSPRRCTATPAASHSPMATSKRSTRLSVRTAASRSRVSSVVGLTVLDVIQCEGLQQNAAEVGGYLKERLQVLGSRHPLLATVH